MKNLEKEKNMEKIDRLEIRMEETLLLILSSALDRLKNRLLENARDDEIKF
jgi:hypothetical protein